MSNKVTLCGIQITSFPQSKNPNAEIAELIALYPLDNLDLEKIKRKSSGQTTETPFGKQKLNIKPAYAHDLIDSRAFVPNKEYAIEVDFDVENMTAMITAISPVDPQVKKHFDDCMKTVG